MGIPSHYSTQLPERCWYLVETLLPAVEKIEMPGEDALGPLKTTFLLSMAMPLVLIPIERIERHRDAEKTGYMDERFRDASVTAAIDLALGGSPIRKAPFFIPGSWYFASIQYEPEMNLAFNFPDALADALATPHAASAACRMEGSQWASCLRNALAHGGIVYLDGEGRHTHGHATELLAFVSARYPRDSKVPSQILCLRISRDDFVTFLRGWVAWLKSSGVAEKLAA
jgi:hypothetical protein